MRDVRDKIPDLQVASTFVDSKAKAIAVRLGVYAQTYSTVGRSQPRNQTGQSAKRECGSAAVFALGFIADKDKLSLFLRTTLASLCAGVAASQRKLGKRRGFAQPFTMKPQNQFTVGP